MVRPENIIKIKEGINLHFLQSEKFKSLLVGVYIKRPLRKSEVALNALLSRILDRSTVSYPTVTDMSRKLEDLYGTILISDVHKYGETQMIQVKLNIPCEQLLGVEGLYEDAFELLNEVLHQPYDDDGGFERSTFENAKDGLITEIKNRKEDKAMWALSRCLENMCEDEPYALHEYGTVEAVEAITPQSLMAHFKTIIQSSEMDIIVYGDIQKEKAIQLVESKFEFERGQVTYLTKPSIVKHVETVKDVVEPMDAQQARLVIGYRMNIPYDSPEYLPGFMGSVILGYGGSSKLFKTVREKESLCYSIFARAERYKSVMFIYAGVDTDQAEKARKLILEEVENLVKGSITEEELLIAKKTFISSLDSVTDFQNSFINYYYTQYLSGNSLSLEAYIDLINSISVAQIVEAVKHFELDTILLMRKEA